MTFMAKHAEFSYGKYSLQVPLSSLTSRPARFFFEDTET